MKRMNLPAGLASALILASTAAAQGSVIVVDDDGGFDFTVLQDAVDAAAGGDTILVKSGQYERLVIDGKALSVIAEADSKVSVTGTAIGAEVVAVRNLQAGQQVLVRGLDVVLAAPAIERAVDLTDNAGAVWIEDLAVVPTAGGWLTGASTQPDAMVVVENSAAVNLTRVQVTGNPGAVIQPKGLTTLQESSLGADAVRSDGSHLAIWDSVLTGGTGSTATFGPTDAPIPASDGGDGLEIRGGSLFASNTAITGGEGGGANPFFWGCLPAANGGTGLLLGAASPQVTTLDSAVAGGAEGPAGVCSPSGLPGQDVIVGSGAHTVLPEAGRSFTASSPHREGETATLSYSGLPGDLVFNAIGASQQHVLLLTFHGVLAVSPLIIAPAGTLDGSGNLVIPTPIPPFGDPTREAAHYYVQSVFVELPGGATPFPEVHLGSGSVLSVLDALL